jgi:acyl carrier protein
MLQKDEVVNIIFHALNNINEERGVDEQLDVGMNTKLFGSDAALDSLSLVSMIIDVEGDVSDALGRSISLTDDRAMSQQVSPFDDVRTLTDYIMMLVAE